MIVYPAIDILDGQVVRLVQGDFSRSTVFAHDPRALVAEFAREGAGFLHLVDLSGARDPASRQKELLRDLLGACGLRVQVGGGVRTLAEIEELLGLGVDRIVLGSLVVTDPDLTREALARFGPDRLTFALDVQLREGAPTVMTHGWSQSAGQTFAQVLRPYLEHGLRRVLCTDIAVDGAMVGPNVALYETLLREFPELELQASGGVEKVEDLRALARTGVHSVVVGRALLSGVINLGEALNYAR